MTTYFAPATFTFLRDLQRNNNRDWFLANKTRYEEHVREPFLRLLGDLKRRLHRLRAGRAEEDHVEIARRDGGEVLRQR